jgi:hypothetical protein
MSPPRRSRPAPVGIRRGGDVVSDSALRAMSDQPASASAAELADGASRVHGAAPRFRAPSSDAGAPTARRARTDSVRRDTRTTRASSPPSNTTPRALNLLLWPRAPAAERKALFDDTSRRLNNADVRKTELLYFNVGLPWVLGEISWQKFPNATFKKSLNELVTKRNQIAHGSKRGTVRLGQLRRWKNMVSTQSASSPSSRSTLKP